MPIPKSDEMHAVTATKINTFGVFVFENDTAESVSAIIVTIPIAISTKPIMSTVVGRVIEYGGAGGDRTLDLLHAMQALSQLSYSPTKSL